MSKFNAGDRVVFRDSEKAVPTPVTCIVREVFVNDPDYPDACDYDVTLPNGDYVATAWEDELSPNE